MFRRPGVVLGFAAAPEVTWRRAAKALGAARDDLLELST
jgi:hypothetical protein